jgi:hypothetical protein
VVAVNIHKFSKSRSIGFFADQFGNRHLILGRVLFPGNSSRKKGFLFGGTA